MAPIRSRPFTTGAAIAAALSLVTTPALARDHYRGHQRYRHDRIDGGDILAGALIIGGIAAIASAATRSSRERERDDGDRAPAPRRIDRDRYGDDAAGLTDEGRGDPDETYSINQRDPLGEVSTDEAVDRCVGAIERDGRSIRSVDRVERSGDGWQVAGLLSGGRSFSCSINAGGAVRDAAVDNLAAI